MDALMKIVLPNCVQSKKNNAKVYTQVGVARSERTSPNTASMLCIQKFYRANGHSAWQVSPYTYYKTDLENALIRASLIINTPDYGFAVNTGLLYKLIPLTEIRLTWDTDFEGFNLDTQLFTIGDRTEFYDDLSTQW